MYESLIHLRTALSQDPDPGFVHLYPHWDTKRHVIGAPGTPCWCCPTLDHIDHRIVMHNPSH